MSIVELLSAIGAKNILVQFLDKNLTDIKLVNKGRESKVTFTTTQMTPTDVVLGKGSEKMGIILWVDRKEAMKLLESAPKSEDTGG